MPTYDTTTRLGIRKPQANEKVNDFTAIVDALADDTDGKTLGYVEGTHALRPSAGVAGRIYRETDTNLRFFDTGSAWELMPTITRGTGTFSFSTSTSSGLVTITHGLGRAPTAVLVTPTNPGNLVAASYGGATSTIFVAQAFSTVNLNGALAFSWLAVG